MANATQSQQDTDPDELLNESGGQLREPQDLPVSPIRDNSEAQKQRMGYDSDALTSRAGQKLAGGQAGGVKDVAGKGLRGGGGSMPGAGSAGKSGIDPSSMVADKLGKGLEKNKGETEKKVDKAAGKATEAVVTAATAGAGTGTLATVAGKVVEKVGTKRIAIAGSIAVLLPIIIIAFSIAYFLNGGAWDAIGHVLTDKKTREFGLQLADNWSQDKGLVNNAVQLAAKFNEHTYKGPDTAIAAEPTIKPEPGSIEEKFQKIDWSKAQFQTLAKNDCRYDLQLEVVVNSEGKTRSIPKDVLDKQTGKTIPIDQLDGNTAAGFCIQQKYPIYNLLWRQPLARELNKKANIYLNYAAPKDSPEVEGSSQEVDKYVYDKTLKRVTTEPSNGPDLSSFKSTIDALEKDYFFNAGNYNRDNPSTPIPLSVDKRDIPGGIKKMYDDMAKGTSPYDLNVSDYFNIPTQETVNADNTNINLVASGISQTICPFVYTFMDVSNPDDPITAKNVRSSIESRLTGSERGSTKNLTLTDTRKADALSSSEGNASIQQNDNWASSTAYQIDVYNQLKGVQMNPEGSSTRAYNAPQRLTLDSPEMADVAGNCQKLKDLNTKPNKTPQDLDSGFQLNQAMIASYNKLKASIKDESPGVFASTSDFGLEQIITGYVRTGSITAVSGLEPGPDNYNRQSMGLRQLMNDYTLGIGGRFLTDIEAKDLAIRADGLDRQQQRENGIAYRLFNTANIHSLASIFQQNTVTPKTTMTAAIGSFKSLLNPLRSLADIHSNLSFYASGVQNKAFAADITGDQYFKVTTSGFTPAELALDPVENAHIIDAIKKDTKPQTESQRRKFAHYDECFKAKIPTPQYFNTQEIPKDGGFKLFFTYFPEKFQLLDANKVPVDSSPDSEFNKFLDCDFLFNSAKNLNNPPEAIAIRYRLYTYYNTQLDYLGQLSSDESNDSIYANPAGGGSVGPGGGSANCQNAQGLEKIPCEGEKYLTLEYDHSHSHVRTEGVKAYRDRCTNEKIGAGDPACNVDCSSFVAVMLYDAFGTASGFPVDLKLFVGGYGGTEAGRIFTENDQSLSAKIFKEINIDTETKPGDIVTMNDHMGVVKEYDPATKKATTIESTGVDGPTVYQWNNIHEEGFNRAFRYIGPGAPSQ